MDLYNYDEAAKERELLDFFERVRRENERDGLRCGTRAWREINKYLDVLIVDTTAIK